jgi:iron complex transport system ATP-binding protein
MVMTTHDPNHAFLFPARVALMKQGRVVATGAARDVLTAANLSETYDIEIAVVSEHDARERHAVTFCGPRVV